MSHELRRIAGRMRDVERREGIITVREYDVPQWDLEVPPDEVAKALWGANDKMARHLQPGRPPRLPNTPLRPWRVVRFVLVMGMMIGVPMYLVLHGH